MKMVRILILRQWCLQVPVPLAAVAALHRHTRVLVLEVMHLVLLTLLRMSHRTVNAERVGRVQGNLDPRVEVEVEVEVEEVGDQDQDQGVVVDQHLLRATVTAKVSLLHPLVQTKDPNVKSQKDLPDLDLILGQEEIIEVSKEKVEMIDRDHHRLIRLEGPAKDLQNPMWAIAQIQIETNPFQGLDLDQGQLVLAVHLGFKEVELMEEVGVNVNVNVNVNRRRCQSQADAEDPDPTLNQFLLRLILINPPMGKGMDADQVVATKGLLTDLDPIQDLPQGVEDNKLKIGHIID